MPATPKPLSPKQLLVLRGAAARRDHAVLPLPSTLPARGAVPQQLLNSLLRQGLLEERPTKAAALAWRTDEQSHQHTLRLTLAGLAAAGPDPAAGPLVAEAPTKTTAPANPVAPTQPARPAGKLGQVLDAVAASGGATITELVTLTGWLPHTTHAVLTHLRQRGFPLMLVETDGRKAYRLTAAAAV